MPPTEKGAGDGWVDGSGVPGGCRGAGSGAAMEECVRDAGAISIRHVTRARASAAHAHAVRIFIRPAGIRAHAMHACAGRTVYPRTGTHELTIMGRPASRPAFSCFNGVIIALTASARCRISSPPYPDGCAATVHNFELPSVNCRFDCVPRALPTYPYAHTLFIISSRRRTAGVVHCRVRNCTETISSRSLARCLRSRPCRDIDVH
ncbi:hypothetical protein BDA96_10G237800 [Sorghum bicolor]|uniref:Uncharacterized protein n=2 Tax=Sorghum bicolor TaxID=4558 RepID=A0A921Q3K1_SORBI|nr:hypothetical protein BDA96_10G237800 [Sorghum bicolor]KXG20308.2 hypothetical protein SORBI_3010G180750 [Sorghum bicolor]